MSIKVLVVDDSAFMRKIIMDMLNIEPDIEVIGSASNGLEALDKVLTLHPDVVTLDIEMPIMNGLECLERIMLSTPTPVIMLNNLTREGADATIKALGLGAVDFVAKPDNIFDIGSEALKTELIKKVKMAAGIKIKPNKNGVISKPRTPMILENKLDYVIAIGTSTGGPKSLEYIISALPKNIPAAITVVQHMPAGFTKSLAARLDAMSELTVKEAEIGDKLTAGCMYIAPGDHHMTFSSEEDSDNLIIQLNQGNPVKGHRPSVNVMMNSLSEVCKKNIIGIIMTGMGSDGCEGLIKLKQRNNAIIIAQDEQSCVVYGMPKAAINAGIVDMVIPLKDMADNILKLIGV